MLSRREVVTGAFLGTAAAAAPASADAAEVQSVDPRDIKQMSTNISQVARDVNRLRQDAWPGTAGQLIADVRSRFEQFLRTNGRFPQYLDVGLGVYQDVYDWHVRFGQPLTSGRTPEGRYAIVFQYTQLILRPESEPGYIGLPYDER